MRMDKCQASKYDKDRYAGMFIVYIKAWYRPTMGKHMASENMN